MVEDRSKIVKTLDHPDMRCLADRFFDEGSAPTGIETFNQRAMRQSVLNSEARELVRSSSTSRCVPNKWSVLQLFASDCNQERNINLGLGTAGRFTPKLRPEIEAIGRK